jgi:GDP-D-mannose dehydratase
MRSMASYGDLRHLILPESIIFIGIAMRWVLLAMHFSLKLETNLIASIKFQLQTGVHLFLHYGDLSDSTNLFHIISEIKPHELYNLGAMSHVAVSHLCIKLMSS